MMNEAVDSTRNASLLKSPTKHGRKWIGVVSGLATLLLSESVLVQASPVTPPLDPQQIVRQVVLHDKELQARRKLFDYDLSLVQQKLDSSRKILESSEKKSVVIADQRPEYETKINHADEDKGHKEDPFNMLQTLDHFDYLLEGTERINTKDCYRIRFTPKPNMPFHNRQEKIMNAVSGHLWVAQDDSSLIQNEGTLDHPVEVGWIFATLREMNFRYEAQLLPNNDYGPKRITYRYLVEIPFGEIHNRVIRTMSNFRISSRKAIQP